MAGKVGVSKSKSKTERQRWREGGGRAVCCGFQAPGQRGMEFIGCINKPGGVRCGETQRGLFPIKSAAVLRKQGPHETTTVVSKQTQQAHRLSGQ